MSTETTRTSKKSGDKIALEWHRRIGQDTTLWSATSWPVAVEPGELAVFSAAPGIDVGPVAVQGAWAVARTTEVRPGAPLGPDEDRDPLRGVLTAERAAAAWNGWIIDRLRDADVEYAPDVRPADPPRAEVPLRPVVCRS